MCACGADCTDGICTAQELGDETGMAEVKVIELVQGTPGINFGAAHAWIEIKLGNDTFEIRMDESSESFFVRRNDEIGRTIYHGS